MDAFALLKRLSEAAGVSGYESQVRDLVSQEFRERTDEIRVDSMGSVIARKAARGTSKPHGRVMIASHLDEVGLIIAAREGSFLRFSAIGGLDQRILPGQRVLVHGSEIVPGVVGTRPPHVVPPEDRNKVTGFEDLVIDTGLDEATLMQRVQVGNVASLDGPVVALQNGLVAGKSFDNRASLTALTLSLELLSHIDHSWDVFAVATVQEEIGRRGAFPATFGVAPDIGIVVDVGFGDTGDLPSWQAISIGSGPAISIGPNIHPSIHSMMMRCAQDHEIPYQVLPEPGDTGTDAWAVQVSTSGVPTGLVSIPLRYMHSTVEIVSLKDIERTSRLLAVFVASLGGETKEHLAFDI